MFLLSWSLGYHSEFPRNFQTRDNAVNMLIKQRSEGRPRYPSLSPALQTDFTLTGYTLSTNLKISLTLLTTVTRSTARNKKSIKIRTWRVEEKETKVTRRGKRGQWLVRTIMTSRADVSLSNCQGGWDVWWQIFLKQRRHKLSWKRNEKWEKVFK